MGTKSEGLSPTDHLPAIFTAKQIKVDAAVSKINGLVNEYVEVVNGVRMRWPMGLGKYLLFKLERSVSKKGVLQVDKVEQKVGNWVYINGLPLVCLPSSRTSRVLPCAWPTTSPLWPSSLLPFPQD